jgi:hypothetical protein
MEQAERVAAAAQLVHQGVAALLASPDWLQLQQTFQLAARQHNATARQPQYAGFASSSINSGSSSISTSRPGGSSPWGFALRQPKQQLTQQQPEQPSNTSTSRPTAAPALSQQQQQQQTQWNWADVQQLMMLGQGSLSKLCAAGSRSTDAVRQLAAAAHAGAQCCATINNYNIPLFNPIHSITARLRDTCMRTAATLTKM